MELDKISPAPNFSAFGFKLKFYETEIPKEKQETVFQRFGKLNEFTQGTGLGLAICSQIVKRFGGKIWIDSEYTSGTRFCFSIPIVSVT